MQMYSCSRNEEYHVAFNLHLPPVFVNQRKFLYFCLAHFGIAPEVLKCWAVYFSAWHRLRYWELLRAALFAVRVMCECSDTQNTSPMYAACLSTTAYATNLLLQLRELTYVMHVI